MSSVGPVPSRLWIDNIDGKFVRVSPAQDVWIDVLPFRAVVQSFERNDFCLLFYAGGEPTEPVMAAYQYDGTRLWSRTAAELPMSDVAGSYYASTMRVRGADPEARLNRGNHWCVVEDWSEPRFGPVQERAPRRQ